MDIGFLCAMLLKRFWCSYMPEMVRPRKSVPEGNGESDEKLYPCLFCPRKFLSSQALSGHQNAHKLRVAVKPAQREAKNRQPSLAPSPPKLVMPLNYYQPASFVPPPYPNPHAADFGQISPGKLFSGPVGTNPAPWFGYGAYAAAGGTSAAGVESLYRFGVNGNGNGLVNSPRGYRSDAESSTNRPKRTDAESSTNRPKRKAAPEKTDNEEIDLSLHL